MAIDDLLKKHFGAGFKRECDPSCRDYAKLVEILYDLSKVVTFDVNGLVDSLDELTCQGCHYGEDGLIVHTEDMNDEEYEAFLKERDGWHSRFERFLDTKRASVPDIDYISADEKESGHKGAIPAYHPEGWKPTF